MHKIAIWISVGVAMISLAAGVVIAKAQIDPSIWYAWILKNSLVVPLLFVLSGLCVFSALREWQRFRRCCWAVFAKIIPPHISDKADGDAENLAERNVLPITRIKTTEEWTQAGARLVPTTNQNFKYQEVKLDGRNFIGCSFTHVSLFYDGTLPCALTDCQFDPDTVKHFHTHSPAIAQWTEIIRSLGMLNPGINFALHPIDENPRP
jgi:hypothetical protein